MKKKPNRRLLREKVLQILYAFEMSGEGLSMVTEGVLSDLDDENDKVFCRALVNKVIVNKKELDKNISIRVANWELNRIALIDKILLRIGICEILYFDDIPPKVSMNEVIEIAKDFSTSNSGKFINGILDTLLSELKTSGKLSKTGRGLIDETLSRTSAKKHDEK